MSRASRALACWGRDRRLLYLAVADSADGGWRPFLVAALADAGAKGGDRERPLVLDCARERAGLVADNLQTAHGGGAESRRLRCASGMSTGP